ncbi:hypothetical protein NIES2135_33150 [Leptolyngbya boryana NIES-2135]|jgi:hypothetical protein|uniref:Uncharacterized protein n=1 Tax=Leptolyngbya boryana NIES-2135 TaxID=1973484 RepID=A0A1Z4JIC6_LEPBY|nr:MULTISPECIES: hypothetical protein [Leptolyngbya]BAY56481.1 hypothetical protein NIES2135_33150 [Leptolyngbya boryana NIES-2135]MBD2371190.1 hypothetical protein [Leptolyngbya sp. FACHB-161]MBD2377663.1 hypothetical protein [Leptolyngbya sp. FACHB-238]MBD2402115.1 hypothetical protein [Leptolyngbya sp. FACHB-239]MBD2408635.1 hypothetical protein [Leptolyngbya sp. FACHB-402]
MQLSPKLLHAIEQMAESQSIFPEQFIIQTLTTEETNRLQPSSSTSQTGLREKEGMLVFDTAPLDHIDFNALIAQSFEEADSEQTLA